MCYHAIAGATFGPASRPAFTPGTQSAAVKMRRVFLHENFFLSSVIIFQRQRKQGFEWIDVRLTSGEPLGVRFHHPSSSVASSDQEED